MHLVRISLYESIYMNIPVVIVNFNGGELLEACIEGLVEQSLAPSKVVVVDNNSTDHSLATLSKYRKEDWFNLIQLNKNVGFAKANNIAFEYLSGSDAEYIALLNPDTKPDSQWLENLALAIEQSPDAGSFASSMVSYDDAGIIDGEGDKYHFSGLAWRDGHGKKRDQLSLQPRNVFSSCAGAACYKAEAINRLNGFDESFFCYMEDVDLGFRLQLLGYKSIFVPKAKVAHVGAASAGGRRSEFVTYHGHRNLEWVYFKNMPFPLLLLFLPIHLLMSIVLLGVFTLRDQKKSYVHAKIDAYKALPQLMAKRREIQSQRKVSLFELVKMMDYSIFAHR